MAYQYGQQVEISALFKNDGGTATSPGTVWARVLKPDGSSVAQQYPGGGMTNPGAGDYRWVIVVDTPGERWTYRWEGQGNGVYTADETDFLVEPSRFY